MKVSKYWYKENQVAKDNEDNVYDLNCWAGSDVSVEDAKEKALVKIQKWIDRLAKGQEIGDYEYQNGEIREELIEEIFDDNNTLIAAITRNRYGALVLNTDAVTIADVDTPAKTFGEAIKSLFGKKIDKQAQALEKIKACQKIHPNLNFIVYQTFAGFRIIITGHNYAASTKQTIALFEELGVDKLYAKLCRVQECYRARLTPKPWRCKSTTPPYRFPRVNAEQQSLFEIWREGYEENSEKYAVCYKVEQLGKRYVSADIDKIISLHDDYVLKQKKLPLA
jgi:hypothetical protein